MVLLMHIQPKKRDTKVHNAPIYDLSEIRWHEFHMYFVTKINAYEQFIQRAFGRRCCRKMGRRMLRYGTGFRFGVDAIGTNL